VASIHKKIKKYSPGAWLERKTLGEKTFNDLHPMGTQAEMAYDAAKASEQALKEAENQPVIPLADEDELARVRRRRAARRGGGRNSTVLSDENRLGG
jgi:hypothetical protein